MRELKTELGKGTNGASMSPTAESVSSYYEVLSCQLFDLDSSL